MKGWRTYLWRKDLLSYFVVRRKTRPPRRLVWDLFPSACLPILKHLECAAEVVLFLSPNAFLMYQCGCPGTQFHRWAVWASAWGSGMLKLNWIAWGSGMLKVNRVAWIWDACWIGLRKVQARWSWVEVRFGHAAEVWPLSSTLGEIGDDRQNICQDTWHSTFKGWLIIYGKIPLISSNIQVIKWEDFHQPVS